MKELRADAWRRRSAIRTSKGQTATREMLLLRQRLVIYLRNKYLRLSRILEWPKVTA